MFNPYGNDNATFSIGEFTAENGTDNIAIYGNLDLPRDKNGLKRASELKSFVDKIFDALSSIKELPDSVPAAIQTTQTVKNPFNT